MIIRDDVVIGIVRYTPNTSGKIGTELVSHRDSLNINHVRALKKKPVAILNYMIAESDVTSTRITNYGYMENGHLVFSLCRQERMFSRDAPGDLSKVTYIDECKAKTAEEVNLQNPSDGLFRRIQGAYGTILRRDKKQPVTIREEKK